MSKASRLRQTTPKPPAARSKKRQPYKPTPLNVTEYQRTAHAQLIRKPHEISASKGGRIPGIPFANRKYPHGKHAVAV
jgi:hypothetical protein